MEDERKLYPLHFCTILDEYAWGSEEFRLADLGYKDSLVRDGWLAGNSIGEVMDMYIDRMVGENVFEYYGRQFPVCVKTLHVKGRMPLQVCPDTETATERYDFLGKDKVWYVMKAGKNSRLMLGFREDTDAGAVYEKCLDNTVGDLLNTIAPHAGQLFHIAPGTPHAAEGDLEILEICESSPLDFCMCGWGDEVSEAQFDPALTLVDALDFIDYRKFVLRETTSGFLCKMMPLTDPLHIYSEEEGSFALYTCVRGEASIQIKVLGQTASYRLGTGETMLIPAECTDFYLVPTDRETIVIETVVERNDRDGYINPDVPARLPGEEDNDNNLI